MFEMHANFYFKHPEKNIHELLTEMLSIFDLNSELKINDVVECKSKFLSIAETINSEKGEVLANDLLKTFDEEYGNEFGSESITSKDGYSVSHWVIGMSGFEVQVKLITFFYELCPLVHAQSSIYCIADEYVEAWLKYHNGNVVSASNQPYSIDDNYISGTIYRWWHSEMPHSFKEGRINDVDYQEILESIHGDSFVDESVEVTESEYNEWIEDTSNITVHLSDKEIAEKTKEASSKRSKAPSREETLAYFAMMKKVDRNSLWVIWFTIKKLITGKIG